MGHHIDETVPESEQAQAVECSGSASANPNVGFIRRPELNEPGICNAHSDELRELLEAALSIRPEDYEADPSGSADGEIDDGWHITGIISTAHWPDVL
jgi:hypothetical protein